MAENAKCPKNPAAVMLGRLGGLKGGKARAERLTALEREKIARSAARARWSKVPKKRKNILDRSSIDSRIPFNVNELEIAMEDHYPGTAPGLGGYGEEV